MNKANGSKMTGEEIASELERIDQLFDALEQDDTLPTFADFFMTCLILDTAEHVDLKKMYPTVHAKFSGILAMHRAAITGR